MKDTAESVELGVSQHRGAAGGRTRSWLQSEVVRVGLAETLCTYIMMVRETAERPEASPRTSAGPLLSRLCRVLAAERRIIRY